MLDVPKLFEHAVTHFREREGAVRSLAVTAALERWVQFELVALLDAQRDSLGIAGRLPNGHPQWWIACEYGRHDLWIADQGGGYEKDALHGVSIELKAIHNNKNYKNRVASIRADLMPSLRILPKTTARILPKTTASVPQRWGIIVATYVLYTKSSQSKYVPLRYARQLVGAPQFWTQLTNDVEDDSPGARGTPVPLEVIRVEKIADLSAAHYIDPTVKDCAVTLLLIKPRQLA